MYLNTAAKVNNYGKDSIIKLAHDNKKLVHPFTAKDDFIKYDMKSPIHEYEYYLKLGVDGIFTEFPKTANLAF